MDFGLECPEERLPQALFSQFPILGFFYVCFIPLIVYLYLNSCLQSKFCLFQTEGIVCENEERKELDPGSVDCSVEF